MFAINRFANTNMSVYTIIQYGGSTFAIIGFATWPDLPETQSLNHIIKTVLW